MWKSWSCGPTSTISGVTESDCGWLILKNFSFKKFKSYKKDFFLHSFVKIILLMYSIGKSYPLEFNPYVLMMLYLNSLNIYQDLDDKSFFFYKLLQQRILFQQQKMR